MSERDYYPAGAYSDPSAPYNEPYIPEKSFDIDVMVVLSRKSVQVETTDYVPEIEVRDEGYTEPLDTSNTDWQAAYKDSGYSTIPEMLGKLKEYAEADLQKCKPNSVDWYKYKNLIDSCDGWVVEEENYEESK